VAPAAQRFSDILKMLYMPFPATLSNNIYVHVIQPESGGIIRRLCTWTSEINDWPSVDNVPSSTDKTFRVRCADAGVTRGGIQTSVVGVDDPDDILFIAAHSQSGVLTRRGTQS